MIERFEQRELVAKIVPLAQTDAVMTFFQGISSSMEVGLIESINKATEDTIGRLLRQNYEREIAESFISRYKDSVQSLITGMACHEAENAIAALSNLPLPEMANLAKNLVNIINSGLSRWPGMRCDPVAGASM